MPRHDLLHQFRLLPPGVRALWGRHVRQRAGACRQHVGPPSTPVLRSLLSPLSHSIPPYVALFDPNTRALASSPTPLAQPRSNTPTLTITLTPIPSNLHLTRSTAVAQCRVKCTCNDRTDLPLSDQDASNVLAQVRAPPLGLGSRDRVQGRGQERPRPCPDLNPLTTTRRRAPPCSRPGGLPTPSGT